MENKEITRHSELLYWSTIEEALFRAYSVKKFQTFRLQSTQEIALWETEDFSKNSIAFYVFIGELKSIRDQFYATKKSVIVQKQSHAKKKILAMLRLSSASIIADSILYDYIFFIKENKFAGSEELKTLIKIGKNIGESFKKNLYMTDPSFFIHDTFGATEQIASTDIFRKISDSFTEAFNAFDQMDNFGFFDLFYDFSGNLRQVFTPHLPASEMDNQVILFQEGLVWATNSGDNTMFNVLFSSSSSEKKEDLDTLFFIDVARAYYRFSETKINAMRSSFFGRILQEFLNNKSSAESLALMSASVLANADEDRTMDFFSTAFNLHILKKYKDQIVFIIENELKEITKLPSYSDLDASAKIHSIVLINIIDKVSSFLSANKAGAILSIKSKEMRKIFSDRLAEIIQSTYIKFIHGESSRES